MVALLFFVMMAVIGSVILAAASAGMGRVKDEDEGDQERYALYSAAKLVVNAFAGKSAFGIDGNANTANWELKAKDPVSYYVDSDNGEYYQNQNLTQKFDPNSISWNIGSFFEKNTADDLSGIREALGKTMLNNCWGDTGNSIPDNWTEGTTVNWEDWVKKRFPENIDDEKFSFVISPDRDWTKDTETGRYRVKVALVIDPYFNIKGTLTVLPDDKNDTSYITGQKYFITIPFATEARIVYTCENKQMDSPVQLENTEKYSTHVSENRKVSFYGFKWQGRRQATITTVPVSDSSSITTN